ncbi:MAG TPA: SPOR domain-containing protein, partial [Caldimonas sp.]
GIVWTNQRTEKAGAWLVYMGGFADREARQRKEDEIRRVLPEFEEVSVPGEGAFGLALGRFDDRANADKALAQVTQRGIRTARIVQVNPASTIHTLRIERADAALAAQLAALKVEALGKGFAACARGETAR